MKSRISFVVAALVLAVAVVRVPSAHASGPTIEFVAAGSDALFQTFGVAAWNDLPLPTGRSHHWTLRHWPPCSSDSSRCQPNPVTVVDSRSASIPSQGGDVWVIWQNDPTNTFAEKIWAYIGVDSVVATRAFFASPRAQLQIPTTLENTSGSNLIPSSLLKDGSSDSLLQPDVAAALSRQTLTAAVSELRPEDALFANKRALSTLTSNHSGLGYGTGPNTLVGTPVLSAFSSTSSTPVAFNILGNDPFTGFKVPAYTALRVGAAPMVLLVNRSNPNGLGALNGSGQPIFTNLTTSQTQSLWTGADCSSSVFGVGGPIVPLQVNQESPLSGQMNTFEFDTIRISKTPTLSQEAGVNPALSGNNPLNQPCINGGGSRRRAIGVGDMIQRDLQPTQDSIGYSLFSFGNLAKIANNSQFGYLTLNGKDPISSNYTNGVIPTCVLVDACCFPNIKPCCPPDSLECPLPNLRNGTYPSWALIRVITDASGPNLTNAQNLVTAAENNVDTTVPDFVPFNATPNGDPGLKLYRSHFTQEGVLPNNGLGSQTEAGGDMGGCIEPLTSPPGILNCHQ